MSGRAGRRGFDPVGNVIFFGIPYRKVQRLMTANIPKLVGNFPITVSLVLRLLLMTTQADDRGDALTKVLKDSFKWIFNGYFFSSINRYHNKIRCLQAVSVPLALDSGLIRKPIHADIAKLQYVVCKYKFLLRHCSAHKNTSNLNEYIYFVSN